MSRNKTISAFPSFTVAQLAQLGRTRNGTTIGITATAHHIEKCPGFLYSRHV